MAYSNYFPQFYQPIQQMPLNASQTMPVSSPSANNGIIWVQGEASAKSYPVAAGQAVLLMDSESSTMYIKSTDATGMPQPLRIFDYTERAVGTAESAITKKPDADYVLRKEFDEFKEEIMQSMKGIRKPKVKEADE